MLKRVETRELLDDDLGSPAEIDSSIADLRRINRWFGGVTTHRRLIQRVLRIRGRNQLSILDVGGATGDLPFELVNSFSQAKLTCTILDRNSAHLNGRFPSVAGDALALPFGDATFDVVSCSLLLHHFSPEEVVNFLREALRVTRDAVVINDLRRSSLHLALVYLGKPLYRSRLTRHDAPASVRRAYTPLELRQLVRARFSNRIEITKHFLYRMGVIVWK